MIDAPAPLHPPVVAAPYAPGDVTRVGALGGTFDPIHYGHLRIAEVAREQLGLARVLFIPNRAPVHKDHVPAPSEDRFAMLVLATQDHPDFHVSRAELDRETPSYAIETLERLQAEMPSAELHFITGADEILNLPSWKSYERLMAVARFVGAPRPGYDMSALPQRMSAQLLARVSLLDMDAFPITSTAIRADVASGKSIRYDTPMSVTQYIEKRGLYRPERSEAATLALSRGEG